MRVLAIVAAVLLAPLTASAAEAPPKDLVFIHGKDVKTQTNFAWERDGKFITAQAGGATQIPADAAKIVLRSYRFPTNSGFQFLTYAKGSRIPPHPGHGSDTVAYTAKGERSQTVNGKTEQTGAGDMTFFPAGSSHGGVALTDNDIITFIAAHEDRAGEQGVWLHNKDVQQTVNASWTENGKRGYGVVAKLAKVPDGAVIYKVKQFRLPHHHVYEMRLPQGAKIPPGDFTTDGDALVFLIKGKMRVTIGDKTELLESGDAYRILAGKPYGYEVLEESMYLQTDADPSKTNLEH